MIYLKTPDEIESDALVGNARERRHSAKWPSGLNPV